MIISTPDIYTSVTVKIAVNGNEVPDSNKVVSDARSSNTSTFDRQLEKNHGDRVNFKTGYTIYHCDFEFVDDNF